MPETPEYPEINIARVSIRDFATFFSEGDKVSSLIRGLSGISAAKYREGVFVCADYAREAYHLIDRLFGDAFEVKWFKIEDKPLDPVAGQDSFSHAMVFIKRVSDGSVLLLEPQDLNGTSYLIQNTQNDPEREDIALVEAMNQHLRNLSNAPEELNAPILTFGEVS